MKTETYLVWAYEQPVENMVFMFVRAESHALAALLFYSYLLKNDTFLPLLLDKSLETGWARRFASRDKNGNAIHDKEEFDKNVREFFGDQQEYARIYLSYFYSIDLLGNKSNEKSPFPFDMKGFILIDKHEFMRLNPLRVIEAASIPTLSENNRTDVGSYKAMKMH